ncbi:FecR family protein [Chitinophaga japonensis]|uniref:FecR family protein n=1 Tax=Chitinophaga japonensis TaxID=104662 RepID=A0A562SI09_CHIJA|nr:FecR family protein [Chitinophaga japonensis]TWI80931.1 FecR family protein [Chitinophaga japonensis]
MSQTNGHYEELVQRYLDGQCTAREVAELYDWLRSSGAHRTLLAAMQREFEQVMQEPHEVPAAFSDRMEARLLQDISSRGARERRLRTWRYQPLAAASVLVLILAGGIWWWWYSTCVQPLQIAQTITTDSLAQDHDIAPGGNKAVLTLADGSTVTLDSAGNQVIQQGKTRVQQHNGRLQYAAGNGEAIGYNKLTVPRGGQFHVVLPDGSGVWLNAASSLRYPTAFTGKERVVEMEGQGYFEIAPDPGRPFIVKVNTTEVQVLGTRFDIMAYPDEGSLNTTLLEGAVNMKQGSLQRQLKPGQQAVLDYSTGRMSVHPVDVNGVIAWKTGFFEFDNADITVIMRQLARWYDIEISYPHGPGSRLFGGRISRDLPLSGILRMLEANGAKFNLEGRRLAVIAE